MGTAGLLASAVGATGAQSLAEALTADRDELVRRWPFFTPTVAPAVVAATPAGPADASPPVGAAPLAQPLPSPHVAGAPLFAAPSVKLATSARPAPAPAMPRVAGTARVAAFKQTSAPALAPPPVSERALASTSDAWFGIDDAAPRATGRPLADRGGVAIEFVDAGPIADVDLLPGGPSPRVNSILPDVIEDAPGALGSPIVAPPLEQVIDSGGMGIDTGLTGHPDQAPVADAPPVEIPWEVLVNSGILDLPRWADADWTPGRDVATPEYLVGPDGTLVVDANGLPVLAPEPASVVGIGAGVALLARRRRRR